MDIHKLFGKGSVNSKVKECTSFVFVNPACCVQLLCQGRHILLLLPLNMHKQKEASYESPAAVFKFFV